MKICPHCENKIPSDSVFCQYCGEVISDSQEESISVSASSDEAKEEMETTSSLEKNDGKGETPKVAFQAMDSFSTSETPHIDEPVSGKGNKRSEIHKAKKQHNLRLRRTVFVIVSIAVLCALVGLGLIQYTKAKNEANELNLLKEEIAYKESLVKELSEENKELKDRITKASEKDDTNTSNVEVENLNKKLADLRREIDSLKKEKVDIQTKYNNAVNSNEKAAKTYKTIKEFKYGTKYSDYYADSEVIIVKVGETKTIRVTCTMNTTVRFKHSSSYSTAEWDKNWTNDSCLVRVTGKYEGTSVMTFSNDANNHSFKVLVIIVP